MPGGAKQKACSQRAGNYPQLGGRTAQAYSSTHLVILPFPGRVSKGANRGCTHLPEGSPFNHGIQYCSHLQERKSASLLDSHAHTFLRSTPMPTTTCTYPLAVCRFWLQKSLMWIWEHQWIYLKGLLVLEINLSLSALCSISNYIKPYYLVTKLMRNSARKSNAK